MNKNTIYNYFNFSLIKKTKIDNKIKETIRISGKPKIISFIIFIIVSSIYTYLCINYLSIDSYDSNEKYIAYIILIIAILLVFIKYKLTFKKIEPKTTNINIYQRELPSKLKPAHVRMLLNDGLIDEKSITTTLLDLIDKDYIKIAPTKDLITICNNNKKTDNLLKYERLLLNYIFEIVGTNNEITDQDLQEKLNSNNQQLFEQFRNLVILSFPIDTFYKKINLKKYKSIYLKFLLAGFIFTHFLSFFLLTDSIGLFIQIYSAGSLLYCTPSYVLNQLGVNELNNWNNLKKYLQEFSNIENKTTEMIELWSFYLTYSVALNIESKSSAEITQFFSDSDYTYVNTLEKMLESQFDTIETDYNQLTSNNDISDTDKLKIEQIIKEEKYKLTD